MPTPDSNYIASVPLQYYFVNKDTGAPLSAGQVYFYIAGSNTPKFVYQETLVDGAFVYTPLANPMILSSIGTFVDGSGNNVTPFYWPFASAAGSDDTTTEQLYFIEVYDSSMVLQFTLDYWPPNADASGLISEAATLSENVVSNPNFSQVLFTPITAYVVNIVASGTIEVGPGWNLVVTGTGTVTLTQTPINADTPSETPYALTITTSSGIDTATLVQTFTSSPRLFTGQYISGSLIAQSVAPVQIIMNFVSSNGTSLPLFSSVTTGSSQWTTLQSSSALLVTANNLDGPTGNTSLQIQLPVQQTLSISSVQLVEVPTATDMPAFIQQTTQQQLNGTFWYWQPKLNYKPINSFLVGWDFPLNPTQLLGSTVAATTVGNGLSRYVWDQTIMFTTTDNIIQYSKSTSDGSFQITNTGASSTSAIIQYLDGKEIFDLFSQRLSIKIAAYCSSSTVPCTVSLYYSSSTIPNINSGNQYSLVSAVSATGVPTVGGGGNYGTWTQIPNVVLNNTPAFTLTTTAQEFDFSGFDGTGISVVSTGYFAIVIGIGPLASTGGTPTVNFKYISCVPGDIPTRPAPLSQDETLRRCQYYYETSYPIGTAPGTASISTNQQLAWMSIDNWASGSAINLRASPFTINFNSLKRASSSVILYAPGSGTSGDVTAAICNNGNTAAASGDKVLTTYWAAISAISGTKNIYYTPTSNSIILTLSAAAVGPTGFIIYHYSANSLIGEV